MEFNEQSKRQKDQPEHTDPYAGWGLIAGAIIGVVIGVFLENMLLYGALLGGVGYVVGAWIDRSRR